MSNRKRRIARPMLESMEPRVVPSAIAVHAHHLRTVAAHVDVASNSAKQAKATQQENNQALKNLQQQQNLVHMHSLERRPSALPTEAEKVASETSSFLKSLESAL
jgi:hypothetical protein